MLRLILCITQFNFFDECSLCYNYSECKVGVFKTNSTGAKQNETKFYYRKNSIKQSFVSKYFEIFSLSLICMICPPFKIFVMMVSGRSVCSMRLSRKACSSREMSPMAWLSPTVSRFGFEHIAKRNRLDFATKLNSLPRKLI